MHRGFKWLLFASIAIGVGIVGLLILAFVPGLGWRGIRPHEYQMWSGTGLLNPWGFLARVTIALLLLAIPLSHIAWLVMAAIWLSRSAEPPRSGKALNCPYCGGEVQPGWKACPHCGQKLERVSDEK